MKKQRISGNLVDGLFPESCVLKRDMMAPVFEVWESRRVWSGHDQEEAPVTALELRQPGILIEVEEIFDEIGELFLVASRQLVTGRTPDASRCFDGQQAGR